MGERAHEEIVQQLVKETDLGKELDKVVENLRITYGEEFERVSGDVWNILLDKAENEVHDKNKIVHKGEWISAHGVFYRWFTDMSGFRFVEQARMMMHPSPPKRKKHLRITWRCGRTR